MTTDDVVIRRARVDEGFPLADLYGRAREAAYPAVPSTIHSGIEITQWMFGQLTGAIGSPDLEIWVAEDDGSLVGLLILDRQWIEQLYIAPERTGRGVGTRLLDLAKARSAGVLQLWTFQSNPRAQRFYERHGFAEAERTDGSTNEEKSPDIRYVWRAGESGTGSG